MALGSFARYGWTALAVVVTVLVLRRYQAAQKAKTIRQEKEKQELAIMHRRASSEPSVIAKKLSALLPDKTILARDATKMKTYRDSYWSSNSVDVFPDCVVRPDSLDDVSTVVKALSAEQSRRQQSGDASGYFFAVRSGGHSPYNSVLDRGVIVDMSSWNQIELSGDRSTVTIGSGARWGQVGDTLEAQGLASVSGRNGSVGVGGFTLGGGLSFYSPEKGFASASVLKFEIVLANGKVVTASAEENKDLWTALKCGSNNFGIVTRITFPTFPYRKVWSGFVYALGFEATKLVRAMHEWAARNDQGPKNGQHDQYTGSPLGCFGYDSNANVYAVGVHMLHTKPSATQSGWPASFKASKFRSIWSIWSTCKLRSMSSALQEITDCSPSGRRQIFLTCTVENDLDTLIKAHEYNLDAVQRIKKAKIKGLIWNYVMQPILPQWSTKGEPGPMGLTELDKPLMILHFCSSWDHSEDDEAIVSETHRAMDLINAMTAEKGTGHPFLYLNYCGPGQKPFEGYGKENFEYLQGISRKYDEEGLFQKSCTGAFKLFDEVDVKQTTTS